MRPALARTAFAVAVLIASLHAASRPGLATSRSGSPAPAPIADLVRGADAVVLASVQEKAARWEGKRIVTDHRIEVERTLKGDDRAVRTVRAPGGEVREPFPVGLRIPGVPVLEAGDRVVLFLRRSPDGTDSIHRLSEGAVAVVADPADGSRFVIRPGRHLRLADFLDEIERAVRLQGRGDRR
jgi:hypothetical protein